MSVKMKDYTYTVNQASLSFSCGTLTSFVFSMSISHYEKWSKVTKTGTLSIIYFSSPGKTTTYTSWKDGNKFRGDDNKVDYQKGLIGSVALTAKRDFRDRYQGRVRKHSFDG